MRYLSRNAGLKLTLIGALMLGCAEMAWTAQNAAKVTISQQNRMFQPTMISIMRGDTVRIVNDDGDLLHHAYVESDEFNFDSGDQEPGSKTDITFTAAGNFTVLCGIHPKMKLNVEVKK